MSRRCYIDQHMIRHDLAPAGSSSRPNEYVSQCTNIEVVGMDGRNDWFRWNCRDCDEDYISMRSEKRQRYLQCTECGSWHHISKGFFDLERFPTVPLRPDEVEGELAKVKLRYDGLSEGSWSYGEPADLAEKMERDNYVVEEHIRGVSP